MSKRLLSALDLLIPVLIWFVFIRINIRSPHAFFNSPIFVPRYDMGHYASIAVRGYFTEPCGPHTPFLQYPCGNIGWFPFWPLVVRLTTSVFSSDTILTMSVLAMTCTLIGMIALYLFAVRDYNRKVAVSILVFIVCMPFSFYFMTGFPYALVLMLEALYIYVFYGARTGWRLALLGVLAVAISASYPSGMLFAVLPVTAVIGRAHMPVGRQDWARLAATLVAVGAPFAVGPLLLSLHHWLVFDDFFLFSHFQKHYERLWNFPWLTILDHFESEKVLHPENWAILWFGAVFLVFFSRKEQQKPPFEFFIYPLFLFLFSPTTGSTESVYRHYVLLFPAGLTMATSSRPLALKLAFLGLSVYATFHYFLPMMFRYQLI